MVREASREDLKGSLLLYSYPSIMITYKHTVIHYVMEQQQQNNPGFLLYKIIMCLYLWQDDKLGFTIQHPRRK